jgi:phosphonate transport system substrate-binding protein
MTTQSTQNPGKRKRLSAAKIAVAVVLVLGVCFGLYNVLKITFLDWRMSRLLPEKWVNLDRAKVDPALASLPTDEEHSFRVAIAPIISPEKSLEMYQGFIEFVSKKLGRKPISLYRPTYSETNDLVRYQRCDIAVVCTYPFIRGEREFGMQALVVPQIRGETTYQSFIIVPKSSSAASLMDLRGKRFGSADIMSTTGWLFPAMLIMNAGENPNHFFSDHVITGSHDKSVQAVVDGFVDGAAVHGNVYEQMAAEDPTIAAKTRILAKSPPFGIPPIAINPNLNQKLKNETLSVLLHMHEDPEGKKILERLEIEKFVIPPKGLFDALRQAIKKLEGWR